MILIEVYLFLRKKDYKLKSLIIISCFFLVFCTSCSDDNKIIISTNSVAIEFVKTLGGSNNESAKSIVRTSDGGYAVFGYTQSIDGDIITTSSAIQYDLWLLKFSADDTLQWQKTFGGSKDDKGYKVIQTNDDGFVVTGFSKSIDGNVSANEGFEDIWLLKLDTFGTIVWQINTGFSGTDKGFSVTQTSDGGYFLGGILDVSASGGLGNKRQQRHAGGDFWGIKLSGNGTIEWRKYFGGTNTDTCYDVVETTNGYLMIGSSDSDDVDIKNNKGAYDVWVVKIDKTGTLLWEKSFGGSQTDEAYQIVKTNDNHFLLVGETSSTDKDVGNQNGGADIWVLKIDTDGNIVWQKTFGGTHFDVGKSIKSTEDGGFLIAGNTRSLDKDITENKGNNDVWALKINSSGKLLWQKTVGGSDIDLAFDIVELSDNSIIVVGETSSNDKDIIQNKGFTDVLIVKLK